MVTIERLRELLKYDPETGLWTWVKPQRGSHKKPGDIAGWRNGKNQPHLRVTIDGENYFLHTLAWFWMTGEWTEVDHRDLDGGNNRWPNLRKCTHAQNMGNQGIKSNNTSGVKGVSWDKRSGLWYAKITVNYKQINLGHYDCKHAAQFAYMIAADKHFGEFARVA